MTVQAAAEVLDGSRVAGEIKHELKGRVSALVAATGQAPGLGTILVGDDAPSRTYVNAKHRDCAEVGIGSSRRELPGDASEADVLRAVDELNSDPCCTGFIVQLPLPAHVNMPTVLQAIDPVKDADGLHPTNLGQLVLGAPAPLPCTPRGIIELLRRHDINIRGAQFCVIGCGTVTLCHEATVDIAAHTRVADVVVAAAGVAHLVKPDWITRGATVLSVGLTRTVEGILGDVHPDVAEVAGSWSRPTGGVGPMTRAMLLSNLVEIAERAAGLAPR